MTTSSSGRANKVGFPGSAPGVVAALDFLGGRARVVLGSRASDGSWRVWGSGSAPLEGIESGRITHLSDAAETVVAAMAGAVKSAGRSPSGVFYTFHDPSIFYRRLKAFRHLPGEGQVRSQDVRAVFLSAQRMAGDFQTAQLYSSGLGFVIDDQDPVADPVGVFGRKLEMEAGFLCADAGVLSLWKDLFRRAYCPLSWAVPLVQASVLGCLSEVRDRVRRLVITERSGEITLCRAQGTTLETYQYFPAGAENWPALNGSAAGIEEIIVVGERAEAMAAHWAKETGMPVHAAVPGIQAGFSSPEDVPTVGLLAVAAERERQRLTAASRGQGLARKARRGLTDFWNEYF